MASGPKTRGGSSSPPSSARGRIPSRKEHVVPEDTCEETAFFLITGEKIPTHMRFRPVGLNSVTAHIWHGGYFVEEPRFEYVGGSCKSLPNWDSDQINSIEVGNVVTALGYDITSVKCLWYRNPVLGLFNGRRPFNDDNNVFQFLKDVQGHDEVDFFVEHWMHTVPLSVIPGDRVEVNCERELSVEIIGVNTQGSSEVENGDEVVSAIKVGVQSVEEVLVQIVEDGEKDTQNSDEFVKEKQKSVEVNDLGAHSDSEFDDYDYDSFDEDYEASEDEEESDAISLDDSDYDESWDWTASLPSQPNGSVVVQAVQASLNPNPAEFNDFENEDGDSDDLETPPGSDDDDEVERRKFPRFKPSEDDVEIKLEKGQIFTAKSIFITAVKEYALQNKKSIHFEKNDSKRVVVKCLKGCPFHIRAAKYSEKTYFQIVTLMPDHTCHRTSKNRQARTSYIAKKFVATLRHSPTLKVKALVEEAKTRWGIVLTRFQAYRAKVRALEMIQGAISEQYSHLRSYADELLRSNPGSTVIIKSTVGVVGPVFERIYVCFAACKTAFATTCRPLIGLDGCFLKGVYGGQLLSAVGKDRNNQMIPIAFAVVEAETKESWTWFLELLLSDLDRIQRRPWCFISDQQKGLVPTLQEMISSVDHRLCVKHLYGNWRKKYPGEEMKGALWAAARASTEPEFDRAMERLKTLNEEAWKDMCEIPPKMWSRSAFSTYPQCDLQVNNMCEAFNRAILEYRDKPIISLIEGLKFYLSKPKRSTAQSFTSNEYFKIPNQPKEIKIHMLSAT